MTKIRLLSGALLAAILLLYHATGLHFIYWPDSQGYLAQALSLVGSDSYTRGGGRSLGYPLLLTLPLALPTTAVAVVAVQAMLVVVAYALMARELRRAAPLLAPQNMRARQLFCAWLPLCLVASTSYSALHVFALSLLPEIMFAVLVLAAVLAVATFVADPHTTRRAWMRATATSALAALPAIVKPHWLFAGPLLALVIGSRLSELTWACRRPRLMSIGYAALAFLLPLAVVAAVLWPDARLAASDPASRLFGPKTLFCNHAHILDEALGRNRSLRLPVDPTVEPAIRAALTELRQRDTAPWKHLGANGDLCNFDHSFQMLMDRVLPGIDAQVNFYNRAYLLTIGAEPVRFFRLVLRQMVLGMEVSFQRFAMHAKPEPALFSMSASHLRLNPRFLEGTVTSGEAGPMGERARHKATLLGWIVQGTLAFIFFSLGGVYFALTAVSLIAGPRRWRTWNADRQRAFLAWIGVPLVAIFGHNFLVAVAHSFDIWRYGFSLFFINLMFVASAGLFWFEEVARDRLQSRAGHS